MDDALQLDWTSLERLLPLCVEFAQQKREGAKLDLRSVADEVGRALGVEDVDAFAVGQFGAAMESGLGQVVGGDEAAAIAAIFAQSCGPVMELVAGYAKGGAERNATELVRGLNKICFDSANQLQPILQQALGVSDEAAGALTEAFGSYLVSVYCFTAAFKIYRKASEDFELAKERRIEAERLSQEAVARIKAEREEMDRVLSFCLLDRLLPFDAGITAMDRAVLDGDDDGFICANAALWEVFGRKAQYGSAAEFEDLMLSDEAFRL